MERVGVVRPGAGLHIGDVLRRGIDHLLANAEIAAKFSREEMEKLFDYTYYTRHVDEVFDRIGLK